MNNKFSEKFKQLRKENGLSYESLEKVLGMDEKEVCKRIFNLENDFAKSALTYVLYTETKEEGLIDQAEAKKMLEDF